MITQLNLVIPEIILILNYVILIIYFGLYTISKKYKYIISYKQNVSMPILVLVITVLLEIHYPYNTHFIFDNMLITNNYINYIKILTNITTIIICASSYVYIKNLKLNNFETYILILSIQIGVLILLMANNTILLYLSLELITITIYILVALNKMNNYSIEAGLKYFIVGAVSSGIFLIGLSILYGTTGMININDLYLYTNSYCGSPQNYSTLIDFYLLLSFLFIVTSLLFKIYSAPFHLWISDIYQGAPLHVLGYISTVPSLVNAIILIKYLEIYNNLYPASYIILFFAIVSIICGSIGALIQRKVKRLLAYSSISHVGYFMIAISIYLANNTLGLFTFFFYYSLYLVNLMLLFSQLLQNVNYKDRHNKHSLDQINDYKGMFNQNSYYIFTFVIVLFSIAGIPPFIGFFGKLYLIMSMITVSYSLYLQIFFIIMAVISCYYYLNIVKNIYFNMNNTYYFIKQNIINNTIIMIIVGFLILFVFIMNDISIIIYNLIFSYIG